jgi:hypothetical protein
VTSQSQQASRVRDGRKEEDGEWKGLPSLEQLMVKTGGGREAERGMWGGVMQSRGGRDWRWKKIAAAAGGTALPTSILSKP